MIIAIFAIDEGNGMGLNGSMPWPVNKTDMQWFKTTTVSNVVVMGRKTWEATGMPKPLPNRINVVATNHLIDSSAIAIHGDIPTNLVKLQSNFPNKNIFVIGGANLLNQALPVIEKMFITRISGEYNCDVTVDLNFVINNFNLTHQFAADHCTIETYERISRST